MMFPTLVAARHLASRVALAAAVTVLIPLMNAGPLAAKGLADGARAEVPIHFKFIEGTARMWVPISIGGSEPIEAILDTGSVELLVLRAALPGLGDVVEEGSFRSSFASGDSLSGVKTRGALTIGGTDGNTDVPFGLIDRVECLPNKTDCPGGHVAFEDYGIAGEGVAGQGFKAILGIGMGNSATGNPLTAVGVSRWIVVIPIPGVRDTGKLILNPSDVDLAGFQVYDSATAVVGPQSELDGAIPGCLLIRSTGERICMPICFDTGAAGLILVTRNNGEFQRVQSGGQFTFEFGSEESKLSFDLDVPPVGFSQAAPEPDLRSPRHLLFAGIRPYLFYEVFSDPGNNQVGLKRR